MNKKEQLKESILDKIDREVKISNTLDEKLDENWVNKQTEKFIKLLKKDLKKYE